jgi:hypothetical protein
VIEQVIENLRRLTVGERQRVVAELSRPDEASRPAMSANERRKLAAERVRQREDFERRSAELEREHEAHLAAAQESKRRAIAALEAREELARAYREQRDEVVRRLVETREPEVAAFIEEMAGLLEELPELQQAVVDNRIGGAFTNAASIQARRTAILAAITKAERISLEALDADVLARQLDALRNALPAAEDVAALTARARRREKASIEAA